MTNADKIRSMSDDELAKLFYGFCFNGERCYDCPLFNEDCPCDAKVAEWQKFMKQEVSKWRTRS